MLIKTKPDLFADMHTVRVGHILQLIIARQKRLDSSSLDQAFSDILALPPHQTTAFGSHRLFLIMAGLKKELNAGETVPVTLEVEYANKRRQTVNATATVKKMALSYKHLGPGEVHDHR